MAGLWKAYKEGGVVMMSIILMWSIFTIGIIIERALYLYGSSINKDVFLATMQKCILAGDVAKAVQFIASLMPSARMRAFWLGSTLSPETAPKLVIRPDTVPSRPESIARFARSAR